MAEKLRNSGIDIIGNVPWGTHFCQFYQTKKDLMDILVPYFKAGLENNEFCIWITAQPLEVEEAKEALRRAVPDFDIYLERGQIEIFPYTHGYINEGVFDSERVISGWSEKLNRALKSGYDGLRATGDTSWLEKEGWSDFVNYENKIDSVIEKHRMIALCPYHLNMCNATEILDIAFTHQFSLIKRAGKWERIENSGRRRAEKAAVQAAKDWEQTFDAVPDLIVIIDNECRIVRANRAMAARLGMTPEECAGLTCYRAMHGTEEPPSFCPHKRVLEDGLEYITEVHEEVLGGDFVLSVSPIYDSDGKVTGCVHVARDITERKQAEEALRQSEERERARSDELAVVLDAVPAAVWITHDPGALQINGNRLSYEWLRIPEGANASKSAPEGEIPETFRMFKDGVELQPEEMPVQMSAAGKEIRNYEFDIVYLDGTVRHILGNARPLRDEMGNPRGSVSAFIDITERKRAEEMLVFERSQLLSIFDGIDDVVYVTDPHTYEVLYANKAMKEKFGGELVGGICYREFQLRDSPCDFCTNPIILKEKDKPYHWEYYNPMVDRYFMIMDRIIKWPDGRDVRFEVAKDITERKKAEEALKKAHESLEEKVKARTAELEEAYKALMENEKRLSEAQKMAHIGNWDWDLITNKSYWSDEMYRIFGLEPQKFGLTYDKILNYIHPDDRDYLDNSVKRALNGEPYESDYRIISDDGEERAVHAQGEVIFDEENTPILMKGTVQDITERKKAEEALEKMERIRIKEIHHRIKNNLQIISSLLDLQAEKFRDKEVLEAFRESQNRVVSMSLIHEELYKGEGTDALDFSAYLRKLAEKLFQTYSLSGKDIHLCMDLEESAFFDMDIAVPLGIIVNELVSNSLKHAFPEKEGEIRIRLRREEKNNDVNRSLFSLIISDNGIGIPEDVELASFESLGLKLVNTLVDQLDGEIKLIRTQGTEFRITFNVKERPQISEGIE